MPVIGHKADSEMLEEEFRYTKYYENYEIDNKIILYKSNGYLNFSAGFFSIFREILEDERFSDFVHYIIYDENKVENDKDFEYFSNHSRVCLIKNGTTKYLEAYACAKYIFYNNSLPAFFVKKPQQICINYWSYTPFQKLGVDVNSKFMGSVWNIQKHFYSCDYLITPNHYTTERLFQAYYLNELFSGMVIESTDLFSTALKRIKKEDVNAKLKAKMNISLEGKKIVLYEPSVRKINGKVIDSSKTIQNHVVKLAKLLSDEYIIITKAEAVDYDSIINKKIDIILAPPEISGNELYQLCDILVTDFKDTIFDFALTEKPIIYFDYDADKYDKNEYYLKPSELKGIICKSIKELANIIQNIEEYKPETITNLREIYRKFVLTNENIALKEIVASIFSKFLEPEKEFINLSNNSKKKILLHVNQLGNISDREICFHILREIDYSKFTVVVDGNDVYAFKEVFHNINNSITIVNSRFEKNVTQAEKSLLENADNITDVRNKKLFQWEFASMYGGVQYDMVIDTVGKKTIWMNVFSALDCEKILITKKKDETSELLKEYSKHLNSVILLNGNNEDTAICNNIKCISQDEYLVQNGKPTLNVLFISAFDSTNYVFVNLIKKLKKEGHFCTVVVKDEDDLINNKMYIQENIPIVSISDYDMKLVNMVDFVFSAPLKYDCYNTLYKKLNSSGKFIITFASLFSSIVMGVFPDLSLALGASKFDEFEENGLRYNLVAIGNPQYDKLIEISKQRPAKRLEDIRKVIIIEQGAFPYGKKGKTQLADTFVSMARNNPDIEFTVKPRYLPSEEGKQLHVLSEHIYDFIVDKPSNLILLEEATVLEDIIQEFDAAITTWSTAYLDAALLGLPLILIDGLDSIDVYNVRNQRIDAAYDRLRHSGCVINYKELFNKNPLPFKMVDEKYLAEEVYDPHKPAVPRVLELLEYLYHNLIITEKRWKGVHQFSFSELVDYTTDIPLIDVGSEEFRNRTKLYNETNKILQKFIFENRCMGQVMDITPVYQYWEYPVNEETKPEEIAEVLNRLRTTVGDIKDNFFENNFDIICKDRILQDYYFQWLFTNKKYRKIMDYKDVLICPESLSFYKGVIHYKRFRYKMGTKYMAEFLRISGSKECKDLRKDMALSAYLWTGRIGKYFILYYLDKYGEYEAISAIDPQNVIYQRDIMLYYRVKSFIKRNMVKEANDLCKEYSKTLFKYKKTKNLKLKVKHFIGKLFYGMTEKLLENAKLNSSSQRG